MESECQAAHALIREKTNSLTYTQRQIRGGRMLFNMHASDRVEMVIRKKTTERELNTDIQLRRIADAWLNIQRSGYKHACYHGKMRMVDAQQLETRRLKILRAHAATTATGRHRQEDTVRTATGTILGTLVDTVRGLNVI